jgi:hypothetical protein
MITPMIYCHTMAISGLSRVRTKLFNGTVIPSLGLHPVQMNRQLSGHRDLRDLPSPSHGQVEELAAPLRLTAHRDLLLRASFECRVPKK